jgi:PAS domain S-box-containing protein
MPIHYSPLLVSLSVFVAILASYVALNLAYNVNQSKGRQQILWLIGGSIAMGIGIWSMHFIGMLSMEMPGIEMAYHISLMVLSVVVAIVGSAIALVIVSSPTVNMRAIVLGGLAMTAAIAGMHYIGMASMRMDAVIEWNYLLVVLSILIAMVASYSALFMLIRARQKPDQQSLLVAASTIMGCAIAGMHYVGMAAATFSHQHMPHITDDSLMVTDNLTVTVVITTLLLLGFALAISIGLRVFSRRSQAANESLNQSEEKFRVLVEAVKDYAIFMLDLEGRITTWNSGAQRITGYTEKEMIGKHVSVFYKNEDIENHTAEKELDAANRFGHFESEGQRVRKDGSVYWASIVISPQIDHEGKTTGYSKVTRDITAMKEAERRLRLLNEELEDRVRTRTAALAQREYQLRSITNALPVLIGQVDSNEVFTFANDGLEKWYGKTVVGKTFREALGEERYPANEPYIKRALKGEMVTYERYSTFGNNNGVFSITYVPEFDDQKNPTGFIVLANDITRYKEIQQELKDARDAAEVANSTKSAFLANMSHEIRTPLGAVLGFSELLLNDDMSASDRHNSVEVIKRNGQLLSNIINDILDLSKVEAGKMEIERIEVPFSEIMKEISSSLSLGASEKGLKLIVGSQGTIPNYIKTDPLRLRQILLNIVGNAIKFTQRGSVQVTFQMINVDGDLKLAFIVKDTGEGIQPEQINRLFVPFSQADASTTRKFGGTGLGLVLSKKLANSLGGDIVLTETTPGKGSTFTITIDPGEVNLEVESKSQYQFSNMAATKEGLSLSPLNILLVDDSLDNQLLITRILKKAGAAVTTASNGREGYEQALNGSYDVVLMDLQMPEMDGYEATKLLRNNSYKKPIIALTAHAMKEERERSLKSGFDNHITKPIDQKLLINTLSSYVKEI